ncbi:probable carboxylesterase 16 [Oryza brachyantha]|uniref:probable carboxylesterase 16 n=1 Tax=Oryza brachyantha TaxID=4533 RepID=UPI001ADB03FF|nr:probable carboxylesterase 16 [Oryza brachyantha]
MPGVGVKIYSVFFKLLLRHKLQSLAAAGGGEAAAADAVAFGVSCRSDEATAPSNPTFSAADGVASKDLHIDPNSSLSVRIFLPTPPPHLHSLGLRPRRASEPPPATGAPYRGYLPHAVSSPRAAASARRRLPIVVQFHGGGFVSGSSSSAANDAFCRRVAKLCDAIVVAVGYRLAPESRYPAAFDDGVRVLRWIAKQANLAMMSKVGGGVDTFGASTVEPWIAAHGDPARCVLLGVSCGANIANFVTRKAVEDGKLFDPIKVVAQVLMYPFFIGSVPTHSEIRLANSYFYDKSTCILAWRLFLSEKEFSLDHPAANPLAPDRGGPPLKCMPPTLTVIAEHDWMRDRAIAYSEELRKVNVDAPVLDYKDTVHEFATLDVFLKTPQAQACAEDIAIWMKKYISLRGHEFSY